MAPGSEVIFTPFGAADPATTAPQNADFLDAMQKVAAHYGVTVVLEADSVPTQTATADFSSGDAATPLGAMAKSAGYAVQALPGGTLLRVRSAAGALDAGERRRALVGVPAFCFVEAPALKVPAHSSVEVPPALRSAPHRRVFSPAGTFTLQKTGIQCRGLSFA